MISKKKFSKKLTAAFGLSKKSMGKTAVRKNFLGLCDELKQGRVILEVTERNEPAIVMLSKNHFDAMTNKLAELARPKKENSLLGSVVIMKDLKEESRAIAAEFEKSIKRTSDLL